MSINIPLISDFLFYYKKYSASPYVRKRIVLILIGATIYFVILGLFIKYDIDRAIIEPLVEPIEKAGIVMLFLLQVLFSLTPFPDNFLVYLGTLVFGPMETFLAIYASYLTATSLSFYIARHYGRERLIKRFPKLINKIDGYDHRLKPHHLIMYRFLAFSSMDYLAYIAGFSKISFKSYFVSSAISMPFLIFPAILIVMGLFERNPLYMVLIYIALFTSLLSIAFIVRKFGSIINGKS
jgi:uncharacterized membrane protein YdjX (TVP38/TMEM64 family)